MFLCFGVFIIACGLTHALEVWNLWRSDYWTAGFLKAVTAVASLGTAALLVHLTPRALAIPTITALQQAERRAAIAEAQVAAEAERRAAAAEVRRLADRYRSLVIATAQIVWTNSAEGEMRGEQPGWGAFTGQSEAEYQGLGWSAALHPDDVAPTLAAWQDAVATRSLFSVEHRVRRHDGVYRDFLVRAVPVLDDGEVREWVGSHMDITERKAAEEALRRAKETAEEASRTKTLFLANMSHELRTPLNAVIGYSELLQDDARGLSADALIPDLQKIQQAGRHLLTMIDGVLDLSKIEAGKTEVDYETFDIAALLGEVIDTIQPAMKKGDNELSVELPAPLGEMRSDPLKLRQAILNLLANAAKFTSHGKVVLRAYREDDSLGGMLVVAVSDTGVGIAPEQLDRLFQPFAQGDPSMTRRFGGTGLGLALSQRFCRLLGGDIEVESTPGSGSTFTLRVPLTAPQRRPRFARWRPRPSGPARPGRR